MRKLFNILALVAVAAMTAISCEKAAVDEAIYLNDTEGTIIYASDPSTRIEFNDVSSTISATGITLDWELEDKFTLYDASGNRVDNFLCTSVEGGIFRSSSTSTILTDQATYTAIYPSSDEAKLDDAKAAIPIYEQNGDDINNLDNACYMLAEFTYSADTSNTITFAHQMAIMTFTFKSPNNTPAKLLFEYDRADYDPEVYTVNYNTLQPVDDLYTSYIMIYPYTAGYCTFSLYEDGAEEPYDVREGNYAKAIKVGCRYTASLSIIAYKFSGGDGSKDSPYEISTALDLRMINEVTTYGKYFLMTQDINLGGQSNEFTPIKDFCGTFDGGGKEISGLYINQSATDYYHGLFDNLYGTVKNLGVSGNVTGGYDVGGIAGRLYGTIINCYNNCIVGGERAVGGIAGYLQDGTVINCYNIGKVSGTTNIGGIAGYMSGICTLENSYNHSAVNGRSNAGAICGYSSSGNVATNCYWASNVAEAPTAGVGNYDTTTSMTSAAMQLVSFSTKLNNNAYEYNADNTDSEQACAWVTVSSSTPVLDCSDITPDYTTPATYSGGDGSIDTPYQITTATDLRNLAMMVNSGETYYGEYFTMTKSIDLGGESEEFTAIGSSIAPFNGSFNGDNNEVSGLYINQSEADYQALFGYISTKAAIENLGVSGKVTGGDYVGGLVGCLYGSTLATGPNVTNCWSNVEVNGNNHVGGLAGEAIYSYIYNSYNKGTVSGADYIGGVIGSIDYTVYLTNIYNTATVTGDNDVAGVVGCCSSYMKYITNCYNRGNITGKDSVGGIIGDAGEYTILYTCYNSGTVQGETSLGAIIGAATSSLTQTSCYWAEGSSNAGIGEYSGTNSTISISTTAMQNDDFIVTLNNAAATYNGSYSTRPQSCAWSAESNSLPELDFDAAPIFSESSTYSGGDGSSETPFLISTAADLRELSTNINSGTTYSENFYLMTNNINLEGVDGNNNGIEAKKFTSIGHNNINDFEGEFDGGGYEISGLYINSDSTCEGLFGYST